MQIHVLSVTPPRIPCFLIQELLMDHNSSKYHLIITMLVVCRSTLDTEVSHLKFL